MNDSSRYFDGFGEIQFSPGIPSIYLRLPLAWMALFRCSSIQHKIHFGPRSCACSLYKYDPGYQKAMSLASPGFGLYNRFGFASIFVFLHSFARSVSFRVHNTHESISFSRTHSHWSATATHLFFWQLVRKIISYNSLIFAERIQQLVCVCVCGR